jgi:hypothetical protein
MTHTVLGILLPDSLAVRIIFGGIVGALVTKALKPRPEQPERRNRKVTPWHWIVGLPSYAAIMFGFLGLLFPQVLERMFGWS